MPESITDREAAVAALGAPPMPVGNQPEPSRLSPQREAEIRERAQAATPGPWTVAEDRRALNRYVADEQGLVCIDFGYVGNRTQADAAFTAHAREDVPALLAELAAVRAERDEARARVRELERPAVEAHRNEIRQSFAELAATARETRDYEGAFNVECDLREREEQWKREDEEASS